MELQGKRALVTGSTSGISETIAKTLATEGVAVLVHGKGLIVFSQSTKSSMKPPN